ncbi:MAG: FAD-dependent oxidoreductase [Phycisphaeraceae bacterium]|nr:FAD-dependent oxidoreductase [Phycisphaeraceae bacterium]
MTERSVIVVGGGVAGIAAALRLSERGARVTLIETRTKLGGRATSFEDSRSGRWIDNCQHVAMGCCTNYLDLCDRLGVSDQLTWTDTTWWVEEGGRTSTIRPGVLPAPAHFARAFASASFLTLGEKRAIAGAMHAALRTDRESQTDETFAQWLAAHNQPAGAVAKFWEPVVVSACNLDCGRVSAASALHVFQEGFLSHKSASRIAVSKVPLLRLYDKAETVIASAGGTILLRTSVSRVGEGSVTLADGTELHADRVICAIPLDRAARFVDGEIRQRDDRLRAAAAHLTHSPIIGVHLAFDRAVMETPHAVLVGRETQWLFRKDGAGTRIHAVISAADAWVSLPEDEIVDRVMRDIRACYPRAERASISEARAVKEKLATFGATTEFERVRPATTGDSELILAGDFVQTGWPATMEGAARSGYMAAAAALGMETDAMLVPPLRPRVVARMIGKRAFRPQMRTPRL